MAGEQDDMTGEEILAVLRRLPPADRPETADESAARVAEGLAGAAAMRRLREREAARAGGKMKLDYTMNLPTILTIVGMALAGLTYVNNLERRIAASEQAIQQNEERAKETRLQSQAQALKNELQDSQNKVQEERIQNLAVSHQDLRRTISEQTAVLGSIREDLATIRVKLSIEKPPRER